MSEEIDIVLRPPSLMDGMAVNRLVERCPPLDPNSSYCNMLQCGHFSSTSVAAFLGDDIVGFTSGYLLPEQPNTLFMWQIAVDERARGRGLALQMLLDILSRPIMHQVSFIETTIAEDNQVSRSLFQKLADHLRVGLNVSPWLDEHDHFKGEHPSEPLVRIGPLTK